MENWKRFIKEHEEHEEHEEYKSNDFCTEFPKACSEVFGTSRKEMPQIKHNDDFESELESPPNQGLETNEPEKIPDFGKATPAYLDSSDDEGPWPEGDQVNVREISIDPSELKPTQKDIYISNSMKKVKNVEKGVYPDFGKILVSQDNYLLDGHHRWAATIIYNSRHPEKPKKITIQQIAMPIKQLLKVANAYNDAHGYERHSGGETTAE